MSSSVRFWTITDAAENLGINRRSVLRYIRDGLPTYGNERYVRIDEVTREYRRRAKAHRKTRFRTASGM